MTTSPAVMSATEAMRNPRFTDESSRTGGARRCIPPRSAARLRDLLREATAIGERNAMAEPHAQHVAAYQADPDEVGRVLLLYSGGLDTSVMVRWIQERYAAEIVTLTVDLGQPDEDWDVVGGKARDLGAADALLVDAREEFAREYVLPAIKANALYGGGYPLFTALGRPLIAKLEIGRASCRE